MLGPHYGCFTVRQLEAKMQSSIAVHFQLASSSETTKKHCHVFKSTETIENFLY